MFCYIPGFLCCAGIFESNWFGSPKVATISGETIPLNRFHNGIRIGHADVTKCDNTGTNGVVHEINRVLLPEKKDQHPFNFFEDYWDFK